MRMVCVWYVWMYGPIKCYVNGWMFGMYDMYGTYVLQVMYVNVWYTWYV